MFIDASGTEMSLSTYSTKWSSPASVVFFGSTFAPAQRGTQGGHFKSTSTPVKLCSTHIFQSTGYPALRLEQECGQCNSLIRNHRIFKWKWPGQPSNLPLCFSERLSCSGPHSLLTSEPDSIPDRSLYMNRV